MTESFDLVIRGGTIVTPYGTRDADVGVRDGRIAALGRSLADARQTIDADGLLVLPGGVDVHCHIEQVVSSGIRTADTFESASISAAFGGTTTLVPFVAQHRGQRLSDVAAEYSKRAEASVIDYGLHLILTDASTITLDEDLPRLVGEGFTSVKLYLTYDALRMDDKSVLDAFLAVRREGAIPLVHAESHDMIAWLTDRLLRAGRSDLRYVTLARPPLAERDAVHHAVTLAELAGVPMVLVHMSGADAVEQLRWAKGRGMPVHGETCPQYLTLAADALDAEPVHAAAFCCSPPLRGRADQEALWTAINDETITILSSDHSAFPLEGDRGKLAQGKATPFNRIANGLPGLEARLPLMFSEGVSKGRISLERFVAITATNPARLFGLEAKGSIAPGADADLVLWDRERKLTIRPDTLHDGLGWTPYEGLEITGCPVLTISRGEVIVRAGRFLGKKGRGRFLRRASIRHPAPSTWSTAPFDPLLGAP